MSRIHRIINAAHEAVYRQGDAAIERFKRNPKYAAVYVEAKDKLNSLWELRTGEQDKQFEYYREAFEVQAKAYLEFVEDMDSRECYEDWITSAAVRVVEEFPFGPRDIALAIDVQVGEFFAKRKDHWNTESFRKLIPVELTLSQRLERDVENYASAEEHWRIIGVSRTVYYELLRDDGSPDAKEKAAKYLKTKEADKSGRIRTNPD